MANHTIISSINRLAKGRPAMKAGIAFCFVAAFLLLVNQIIPSISYFGESDKRRVEDVISNGMDELSELANLWFDNKSDSKESGFEILSNEVLDNLRKKRMSIFFLSKDTLKAWGSIPNINDKMSPSIDTSLRLHSFRDGYYLAAVKTHGSKSVVYAIEVQKNFSIKNSFLANSFNPAFKLPENIVLNASSNATKQALQIDYKGNSLFSLSEVVKEEEESDTKGVIYYIALIVFIIGSWNIIGAVRFERKHLGFFAVLLLWMALNALLVKIIFVRYHGLYLFSPALYTSELIPSFGTLLVYVLLGVAAVSAIYSRYRNYKIASKRWSNAITIFLSVANACLCYCFYLFIISLVNNSTISFGILRMVDLNQYSVLCYVSFVLFVLSLQLLINLYVKFSRKFSILKRYIVFLVPFLVLLALVPDNIFAAFVAISTVVFALFDRQERMRMKISIGLLAIVFAVGASGVSLAITKCAATRNLHDKIAFAESTYNENDPILESMIPDLSKRLESDTTIARLIADPLKNEQELNRYIKNTYLVGYVSRYNLLLTICPQGAQLLLSQEKRTTNCRKYFETLFLQLGSNIPNSNFYFIRNYPGQLTYIGDLEYNTQSGPTSLFVELDIKTINSNPGYPELLIKNSQSKGNSNKIFDYALYIEGHLAAKNGEYTYPLLAVEPSLSQKYYVKSVNGYSHLYYRFDEQNMLIVSNPNIRVFDIMSSFSYLFFLLSFFCLVFFKWCNFPLDDSLSYRTFKGKIALSFIVVLTIILVVSAMVSLYYGIERFYRVKDALIRDKMKSAIPAVRTAFNYADHSEMVDELMRISNYLYVDVNLYDKEGNLIASSRPEVFSEGLQGNKIAPKAYKKLMLDYEGFFVEQESIGGMVYTSSYSPIFGTNNTLVGYVNLPYFMEYYNLKNEIYTITIATANIFILLLLPVVFIGILISRTISRPLGQVRSKMKSFDLNKNLEPVPYNHNDEIGDLITEFNKMVVQVKSSAERLADSERESAWREMARQIAHEIKNPLTPMKLSLQYVVMLKKNNDARWIEQFDRYAASQIEQIDSLARIATEFSNFAKINFDEHTPIFDFRDLLNDVLPIFDGFRDIKISVSMTDKECTIQADREHAKRVFVNLVKNAIQSFDNSTKDPCIDISIENTDDKVLLMVKDNGRGIPEAFRSKVFTPNFTTKSSGSGLGLAISKKLVEAYHGRIWFTTKEGIGTTFYVEFPYTLRTTSYGE